MSLRFHKMHGAGNDFMVLDLREGRQSGATPALSTEQVRHWGNRNTGIGFDQLLVLDEPGPAGREMQDRPDAAVRIWNSDGSTAEQCGNGMRAIGLYLSRSGATHQRRFLVTTSVATIELVHEPADSAPATPPGHTSSSPAEHGRVRVSMGKAGFDPTLVPYLGAVAESDGWYHLAPGGEPVRFGVLTMGNPHAIVEVDDCDEAPLMSTGDLLRSNPAFPESCNVGFAQVIDPAHIRLRVLERGANETLACGSGACAAVAWLSRLGRVGSKVRVTMAGGTLDVHTEKGVGPITLTGPATYVFEGTIE